MPQMQVIHRGIDPRSAALAAGMSKAGDTLIQADRQAQQDKRYKDQQKLQQEQIAFQEKQAKQDSMMKFAQLAMSARSPEEFENFRSLGTQLGIDTSGFEYSNSGTPSKAELSMYEYAQEQLAGVESQMQAAVPEGWGGPGTADQWYNEDGSFNEEMHSSIREDNRNKWTSWLPDIGDTFDGYDNDALDEYNKIGDYAAKRSKLREYVDRFQQKYDRTSGNVLVEMASPDPGSVPTKDNLIKKLGFDPFKGDTKKWESFLTSPKAQGKTVEQLEAAFKKTQSSPNKQ